MTKEEIIKKFNINSHQENLLDTYIFNLKQYNKHTNLVGGSTLEDPWKRHILDCLQILPTLNNYKCSILDMGTGDVEKALKIKSYLGHIEEFLSPQMHARIKKYL